MFVDAGNATNPNLAILLNTKVVDQKGDATLTVTDDYFGSVRSGLTPYDMGAYAYVYDPSAILTNVQDNNLHIFSVNSAIMVSGFTNKTVNIYSIEGKLVKSQQLTSDIEQIPVASGFYIVRVDNRVAKISVR